VRFFLERRGQGPAVVLVHGFGFSGAAFDAVATGLSDAYETLIVDLPGCGRSPWWTGATALGSLVDELVAELPAVCTWVGWSFGGLVALAAACRHPARVAALALIATSPRFLAGPGWPSGLPEEWFSRLEADLRTDPGRALARFSGWIARRDRTLLRELRDAATRHGPPDPAALLAMLEVLRSADLRLSLARIGVPTLIISGPEDEIVPPAAAERMAAWIPGARFVPVTGAGHAPFLSHPQETLAALRRFLSERPHHR
jgi:pimeloyl-[acyl-carrier protein] methyl ester esterase